jgi:hypothetical protein
MKTFDLDAYLRANPGVEAQVDVIKQTMGALKDLREVGVGGKGYTLAEPYGARGAAKQLAKTGVRPRLKV